ncbi:hypothetical protein [Leptospira borgpetersenii]|uniref:hypothetical protein n=1 Tax=Leptospira borgpetersenii TaxID=174 RepID=UPI000774E0AF|nr:hypothetical protein [Leptospira borgpetersenii]MBE8365402.1 hypothetical protein [Leptospira borgpetersenii serovar Balcanica]MBE8368410.1 hypothetical protein [Leptospira borgpetersenii serovar Balcanica]MBE8424508.1 hypothetical protein [Leptospira borgpetersenii serovar Balcanica]MBF3351589.1 hypothetical protein [Leptospira borgpetersenii serovar Balcanica]MBF3378225.1 hypothetical protein [Leptospira borgpetersenii serovar Balcanica]
MKVKVAHLFRKIEEMDRDILELGKIQERISSDRDYSEILKDSIRKEMENLESGKAEILSLKIKEEPAKIGFVKNSGRSSPTEMKNLYSSREKNLTREISVEIPNPQTTRKKIHKY